VLQHGSLPLTGDLQRITQALVFPHASARQAAAERLSDRATTVAESLGVEIAWAPAAQAFVDAFQEQLNLHFVIRELKKAETPARRSAGC
jgi:lipoate-protein ligase A